ncbi:MAG: hypothetical protein EOP01_06795 [Propionibacteriaceae bacterium]|nr:MAG: hypothetical protein EOP01_06795 [Propionibacteriaceae bacterium]
MSDPHLEQVFSAMTSQHGDLRLSLHAYEVSKELGLVDLPVSALIAAAMRKADTGNVALLQAAFPGVWQDLAARYEAPGGLLAGER